MKKYLSFGGGVNSVALYLYLLDQGEKFEAVFVDHGGDWPETYEYVDMFRRQYPVTVLKPNRVTRWCTSDFKRNVLNKYQETPAFVLIGFDWDERHRAKIYFNAGREFRYPLIEAEIGREGCKQIIRGHSLPVPVKSGCYICPFQPKLWAEDEYPPCECGL